MNDDAAAEIQKKMSDAFYIDVVKLEARVAELEAQLAELREWEQSYGNKDTLTLAEWAVLRAILREIGRAR